MLKSVFNIKFKKTILVFNVILILILTFYFLFFNKCLILEIKTKFNIFNVGNFPVRFSGDNVSEINFTTLGSSAVVLSDTSLNVIGVNSKIILNKFHNLSVPILKKSNSLILSYDFGGFDFKIQSKFKEFFKNKLQNKIIDACISDSGVYGFLTDSEDYISQMLIFDKKHKQKYKYCFSNIYPSGISISRDGKIVSICALSLKNENMISVIWTFDLNSQTPNNQFEIPNNMLFEIHNFNDSNIVAFGDNSAVFLNTKNKKLNIFNFNDEELILYDINPKKGVAMTFSETDDGRSQIIKITDKQGNLINKIDTKRNLKSISYKNNLVGALSENTLSVYDIYSGLRFQNKVSVSSKIIKIISNSSAYILGTGMIDKIFFR